MYADVYLGSPSKLCHSVPCGNKQCGWSEVSRGWKQLLQLITSSLEKGGIRCLPVEYVSKSCNVHITPEWSNQWNVTIQWKPSWCEFGKWESKWKNSIVIYLWIKTIERSNPVALIITSRIFLTGSTKISYYIKHPSSWMVLVSESMHSWLTKSVLWVLPISWIGVERLIGGELPSRTISNSVSPTFTPKSKKLVLLTVYTIKNLKHYLLHLSTLWFTIYCNIYACYTSYS